MAFLFEIIYPFCYCFISISFQKIESTLQACYSYLTSVTPKKKKKYWANQAIGIHVQDTSKAKKYSVLVMHFSVSLKAWSPARYVGCSLSVSFHAPSLCRSRLSLSAMTARPVYFTRYQWVVVVWCFEVGKAVNKNDCKMETVYFFPSLQIKSNRTWLIGCQFVCKVSPVATVLFMQLQGLCCADSQSLTYSRV